MKRTRKWQARFRNSVGGVLCAGVRRRGRGAWHHPKDAPPEVIQYLGLKRAKGAAGNYYQRSWKNVHAMHDECKPESHFWRSWLIVDFMVEEAPPIRPPAIKVDLGKLREILRDMNEGRNLKRYADDGRCHGGCFDVISFGWKDADLDPGGCCGIDKLIGVEGKRVVFEVSGHKTFCDPCADEETHDTEMSDNDWLAHSIVCECGSDCEWDGDSWCASFREIGKAPVCHRKGVVNYEATARRIVKLARLIKGPYQEAWISTNEQLDEIYEEIHSNE